MQQKTKSIIRFVAIATLVLLSLYYFPLLYFGCASFITTILVYTLLYIVAVKLIDVLNSYYMPGINPNVKILLATTTICLLCGEYALRFVFKKNLVYSEKNAAPYLSYYTYIYDWNDIKNYFEGKTNYWYLISKPNSVDVTCIEKRRWEHKYNSQGFREGEKPPQQDDTDHLVMGIGDSFTEGVGTHCDSTWLRFFEREINTRSNCKIRTFNAGAKGSDVFFEYLLLEKLLQQYHPNTVVLCINSTDIDDIIIKGGCNRFKKGGKLQFNSPPPWERLYAVSFIVRAIVHTVGSYDWTLLNLDEREVKTKEAVDSIGFMVHRFQQLAKEKNFHLVVAFHPRENEIVTNNFPLDSLAEKLALDTTLNVVNLKQRFAETGLITKNNASGYYWKYDLHHNAAGYKIMGDLIAEYMRSRGVLCTKHN